MDREVEVGLEAWYMVNEEMNYEGIRPVGRDGWNGRTLPDSKFIQFLEQICSDSD